MKPLISPRVIALAMTVVCLGCTILPALAEDCPPSGCVGVPADWHERQNAVSVPAAPAMTTDFPAAEWWTKFNDPHLNHYVEQALAQSPTLKAAMARVQEAEAVVGQTRAKQLPSLSLNPNAIRVHLPNSSSERLPAGGSFALPSSLNLFTLPLQAAYELDLFGKNRAQTRSSRAQAESVEFDREAVQIALVGDVASAYFNLLRFDALIHSQEESLAKYTRIHELRQSQNKIGLSSYDEVIRADRDVVLAQAQLTTYRQQQALFAHQLAVLTGVPPMAESVMPRSSLDIITLPSVVDAGIPSTLLLRRPDILAEEKRMERARFDVSVARKAFLPTINLSAMFGIGALGLGQLFDWDNLFSMLSGSLAQPIYQGGRLKSGLKLEQARQEEQFQNYRQTILKAFQDVEDNLALLRTEYEHMESNTKRLSLTEHQLRLTQNLYENGLSPRLDVIQAEAEVIQYQQVNIQSKMDAMIATVGLYKALGGGF